MPEEWTKSQGERLVALETNLANLISGQRQWMLDDEKRREDEIKRQNGHHGDNQAILKDIKAQTELTNGRLKLVEIWKAQVQGGWWVIATVMAGSGLLGFFLGHK